MQIENREIIQLFDSRHIQVTHTKKERDSTQAMELERLIKLDLHQTPLCLFRGLLLRLFFYLVLCRRPHSLPHTQDKHINSINIDNNININNNNNNNNNNGNEKPKSNYNTPCLCVSLY